MRTNVLLVISPAFLSLLSTTRVEIKRHGSRVVKNYHKSPYYVSCSNNTAISNSEISFRDRDLCRCADARQHQIDLMLRLGRLACTEIHLYLVSDCAKDLGLRHRKTWLPLRRDCRLHRCCLINYTYTCAASVARRSWNKKVCCGGMSINVWERSTRVYETCRLIHYTKLLSHS